MRDTKSVDEPADRVAESVRRALRLVGHAENGVEYAEDLPEDATAAS